MLCDNSKGNEMSPKTRFENLLEAVPDALVGMDQKGVIRFVNGQTESLFGYDRDQLIGQHIDVVLQGREGGLYIGLKDGQVVEVSSNYFAISRVTGDVYCFGEDVDMFKADGKVTHEGSWREGRDGAKHVVHG